MDFEIGSLPVKEGDLAVLKLGDRYLLKIWHVSILVDTIQEIKFSFPQPECPNVFAIRVEISGCRSQMYTWAHENADAIRDFFGSLALAGSIPAQQKIAANEWWRPHYQKSSEGISKRNDE